MLALGCISGGLLWVVIYVYFIAAVNSAGLNSPTFIYMILFIYFMVFNIFALNIVLQYKAISRWKEHLYGERVYIVLSFVAKSILSWLVFIGNLCALLKSRKSLLFFSFFLQKSETLLLFNSA
jgi:hypothetical protein